MIRYERGLNHNYLIFSCEGEGIEQLSLDMLRENKIEGLLNFKLSRNNLITEVSYETSNYKSMVQAFENERINNEVIICLMNTMMQLLDSLEEHYLEHAGLVLNPEYVYWNKERSQVLFCYNPIIEDYNNNGSILQLSEFILHRADYMDYKSVVYAYEFNQYVKEGNFSIRGILERLNTVCDEQNYHFKAEKTIVAEVNKPFEEDAKALDLECSAYEADESKPELKESTKNNVAPDIKSAMSKLFEEEEDDWEKEELSGSIFGFGRKKKSKKVKVKKGNLENEKNIMEESFFHTENVDTDMGNQVYENRRLELKSENNITGDFKIENYPFLIGNLQYAVDACIESDDISRFHARLDQNRGKIYLSDLNSSSGTFLNGELLKGSVQKEIKNGDRISFGKIAYAVVNC